MKKSLLFITILFAICFGYSQGDTCATATAVTCGSGEFDYVSYTTTGFTDTAGNSSNDVFFTFTPGAIQNITIDTCFTDSGRDTKIVVYSDCSLSTIITESDNEFAACGIQARVNFISDAVSTYIIMVEGGDNPGSSLVNGDFEMVVFCETGVLPQSPQGITCNPSTSGPSIIFSDELDVQGGWTGDIATSGGGSLNSGMWEIIDASPATTGGSNSGSTGPDAQYSGTTFMNFEASGTNSTATASAVSPAIDLTGTITEDAELTFYMHAYGNQMGTLNIGVGNSVSGPFTTEYTWSGNYQLSASDPWFQIGVDLSSYIGQVIYLEFSNTGDPLPSAFRGDMSIDLVEVHACDTVLDIENSEDPISNITLYPNPIRDYLNIRSLKEISEVSLFNLLGQEIQFKNPKSLQTSLDLSNLNTGIYIVKVKIGDAIGTYKVIKE